MRNTIIVLMLVVMVLNVSGVQAQDKYLTKSGLIEFYSHTPIEDIKAINQQVTSIIDISTGEVVFSVLMRSFEFQKKLMQEHFNENYLESAKFPKAKFSGMIENIKDIVWQTDSSFSFIVNGEMEIHGVKKQIKSNGLIKKTTKGFEASTDFIIKPEDYKIKIPKVVRDKIAKSVKVSVKMSYLPYK